MSRTLFYQGKMGIVNWTTDNVDESQLEFTDESTIAILKMDEKQLANRWEGKLLVKPRASTRVSVELKKAFTGASIAIRIHDCRRGDNKMVNISMSGTAHLNIGEIFEMNLAITEGIAVYRLPDHWRELNEYLERSKGRQERRKDGKFVKQTI